MTYAISYVVPSDEAIYGRVKEELGDERADGLLMQLVSHAARGLRHTMVWESQESWERFQRERLGPAVGKVLANIGMPQPSAPPPVEELRVVDLITS